MFSTALVTSLQVYGIAIGVSFFVAALIKLMVFIMARLERPVPKIVAAPKAAAAPEGAIPDEVVAVITAAVAAISGSHRILHISEAHSSWADGGRAAHHASHSGHFQPRV